MGVFRPKMVSTSRDSCGSYSLSADVSESESSDSFSTRRFHAEGASSSANLSPFPVSAHFNSSSDALCIYLDIYEVSTTTKPTSPRLHLQRQQPQPPSRVLTACHRRASQPHPPAAAIAPAMRDLASAAPATARSGLSRSSHRETWICHRLALNRRTGHSEAIFGSALLH